MTSGLRSSKGIKPDFCIPDDGDWRLISRHTSLGGSVSSFTMYFGIVCDLLS